MLHPAYTIDQNHVRLSADLPVRTQRLAPQPPCRPHNHEFYEIVAITAGSGTHITSDGKEPIRRGRVFILSPKCVHAYSSCHGLELLNLYYLADWFLTDISALRHVENLVPLFFSAALYAASSPERIVAMSLHASAFARLEGEMRDLLRAQEENTSLLYRESCFFKIIDILARSAREQGWIEHAGPVRTEVDRGLRLIELSVLRREPFDADSVARTAGLSTSRFAHLVRTYTGLSPRDYYQRHRIRHVCRHLLSSRLSIAEIAHEYGFADAAHLNRHFRHYQDMTPTDYRRRFNRE